MRGEWRESDHAILIPHLLVGNRNSEPSPRRNSHVSAQRGIKSPCDGATIAQGDDAALSAQCAATSASSTRRFRCPSFTSQNCGYVLTNSDSRLFVISIEDLLVGISIKLQYTPEKRRYSHFDLLVTLKRNFRIPKFGP